MILRGKKKDYQIIYLDICMCIFSRVLRDSTTRFVGPSVGPSVGPLVRWSVRPLIRRLVCWLDSMFTPSRVRATCTWTEFTIFMFL